MRKRVLRLVVITIIGLYFATKVLPLFSEANNKTYIVEYGKIEELVPVKAYVIRDEKVISYIKDYSDMELLVEEGSIVAKGQEIARFYLTNENDISVEKDLKSIEARIESINEQQNNGNHFQNDINKINEQVERNVNLLEVYLSNGEYDRVYNIKNEINNLLEKKNAITGSTSFTGINLNELEEQKSQLKNKLNSYVKVVKADRTGYIAIGSDGLEDLFDLSNIIKLNFESFQVLKENSGKQNDGMSIRIVENFKYNYVIEVDNNHLSGIAEGRVVRLRDNSHSNREYKARVRKVISDDTEDSSLIILSINEHMDNIFSNRVLQLDLLKNIYEGITVPNRSIIEIDEKIGVYKVDVNGFVSFVPVMVKGRNDDLAIVHNSHFDTIIDGESKRVLTISSYDEIVLDGASVIEGQKIR